jgi:predicted RNA binding protein YcfA (HicA-like mRNA interferase family)
MMVLLAGGGEPIEDGDAALREIGIDPDEIPDDPVPLPDFIQEDGMVRTTFSGREVAKVLRRFGWRLIGGHDGHRVFQYENLDTGEVRVVTVPIHDGISIRTLYDIADQCGARTFGRGVAESTSIANR